MRLGLDHHYSKLIAETLRDRGHDVVAAIEVGWEDEDDEPLLARCAAEKRVLLTNNVADFAVIARRWQADGRSHHGLWFTSDASLPRSRDMVGRYVELIDDLMRANPEEDSFVDRNHWL